ncbi:MAG: 50S ribosomal protein L25 [Acidimicrobiales bacterium]
MAEITLVAEAERTTGSRPSRRLRNAGRVPAVLYGHGMKPLAVSVDARELRSALSSHGLNRALNLEVGGTNHLVMARELQRHPVRRTLTHVDFQVVRRDEVVHAEVPVTLTGDAVAVTREQGILEHTLSMLSVRAIPEQIPSEIAVDVSGLAIGDVVRVKDLKLPAGVTTDLDPEEPVVIAVLSTVSATVAAQEAAEAEVAAPGAAAPTGGEEG